MKARAPATWASVPKTCKTIRTHVEEVIPLLSRQLVANSDALDTTRIEHRIKAYALVDRILLDMHSAGMFSLPGLNFLFSGLLFAGGIRTMPFSVSCYLQNIDNMLNKAAENNTFTSLPRGSSSAPPQHARAAWAEVMNVVGLSHKSWSHLLGAEDTWSYRFRCTEDAAVRWAEGLQQLVNSSQWHLEFMANVAWYKHPQNQSMLVLRGVSRNGGPPAMKGPGYYSMAAAAQDALRHYSDGSSRWKRDFVLHRNSREPDRFALVCERGNVHLPPSPTFVILPTPGPQKRPPKSATPAGPQLKKSKTPTASDLRAMTSQMQDSYGRL